MRKIFLALLISACSNQRGTEDQGSFVISGSVPNPRSDSKRITHVVAISPMAVTPLRRVAALGSDGSFSLNVVGGKPWAVLFVDQYQSGAAMLVSALQIGDFMALPILAISGTLDLGTITPSASTGIAASTLSADELVSTLGVTADYASVVASLDSSVSRYFNPDLDANNAIDALDTTRTFALDFHSTYVPKLSGTAAHLNSIFSDYLFDQSGFTLEYNKTLSIAHWSWSVDTTGDYVNGSEALINSAAFSVDGSAPSGLNYAEKTFSITKGFGPIYTNATEMPSGDYLFQSTAGSITFTDTVARSNAALNAMANVPVPFIKFTPKTNCSVNCSIASISYSWRKLVSGTWTELSAEELAFSVADKATLRFYSGASANGKSASFEIPKSAVSGSVEWTLAGAKNLSNLTESEFTALKTNELCDMELYYDDAFGYRVHAGALANVGSCN